MKLTQELLCRRLIQRPWELFYVKFQINVRLWNFRWDSGVYLMNTPALIASPRHHSYVIIRVYPWQVAAKDIPRYAVAELIADSSILVHVRTRNKGGLLRRDTQRVKML